MWREQFKIRRPVRLLVVAGVLCAGILPLLNALSGSGPAPDAAAMAMMRYAVNTLADPMSARLIRPCSVAEFVYDDVFQPEHLTHASRLDYEAFRIGPYSFANIADRRMTREELVAEVERVSPGPRAWDTFGPVTLCFDARVYESDSANRAVIVGKLKNYPGAKRGKWILVVAYADGHVASANGPGRNTTVGDDLARSIAYYDSLGIPMPAEMVKELREALGGE